MSANAAPAPGVGSTIDRSASPTSPRVAGFRAWAGWIADAGAIFSRINGTTWSASFSYYGFFSLVPLTLLLVTVGTEVAAHFVGEEAARQRAFDYVVRNIPLGVQGQELLSSTLQGVIQTRGKIGLIAGAGLLWSSLGFFQSLVGAVDQAFGRAALRWWNVPLKNLAMLGVLASALLVGNVVPLVLKTVRAYVNFHAAWMPVLFHAANYLGASAILFYGFLLFYRFAPPRHSHVRWADVWVPALIVTVLLQFAQQIFVFYSAHITNFNAVYGAFGGVIALLLWTYLSGIIVVYGGCLCAARHGGAQIAAGETAGIPAAAKAEGL